MDPDPTRQHPRAQAHLFTIRLWREDLDANESEWRGKVVHTRTGEARYFRDWITLLAFVRACAQDTAGALPYDAL